MSKKLLSCMLAIAMVSTLATATTTASADDTQTRGTIYFDSTNLYGATSDGSKPVYCYAWSNIDGGLHSWTSSATKMTNVDNHLYSYNVPAVNSAGQKVDANLMIFYANGGAQSWEVTFNDDCIGDTAYIYESIYEGGTADSYYGTPMCKWKNTISAGPHLVVSSTGKITGYTLLDNETPESVADTFIKDYKENMEAGKAGYDNADMVTDAYREELIRKIGLAIAFENNEPPTEPPIDAGPHIWESIAFAVPESWRVEDNKYYVHLWNSSQNEESPYEWQSIKSELTYVPDMGLAMYVYPENSNWDMMFVSNSAGKQTLNSVIGSEYIGNYFTVKENNYGIESINDLYDIVWEVHPELPNYTDYCSTHREIVLGSSIGIVGEAYVEDETDDTIFNNFRNEYGKKADGSCLWDETMKDIYNMSWEEAEKHVAKLLSVEYLLDGFDYAEEYGLKKGLPVVEGMEIPKRYSKDFIGAGSVPSYWDGYYKVYYFEAPESWLTEHTDKKLDGYEIGVYWEGSSSEGEVIYDRNNTNVPAKKLSKLDENGKDIYADSNIYYAFVPTFAHRIIWNNGIDTSRPDYFYYISEVSDFILDSYGALIDNNIAVNYKGEVDGVNVAGCLMYRPEIITDPDDELMVPNIDHVIANYKFFDPQTGETTTIPLKNEYGQFVTKTHRIIDFGVDYDFTKAAMNPYYDMDYAYTFQNVVDEPIDGPTDNPTDNPTQKPTEKPTTAPTQAPTNAPSTNTSNGTVNTAQSSAVMVLAITLLASMGVASAISKKRESKG